MNRFQEENHLADLPLANLIVGESMHDAAFIDALLTSKGLRQRCHLGFPDDRKKGKDGFGEYLLGLRTKLERSTSGVQHILIVADSDDDPEEAFTCACNRIREANDDLTDTKKYAIPAAVRVREAGNPSMTVVTIPFNSQGCLETLLVAAADDGSHPLHVCFDEYWKCVHFDRNRKNVESKQKFCTIIAATNQKNPSCSPGLIWSAEQAAGNPMRIDHPAFREFTDFLCGYLA